MEYKVDDPIIILNREERTLGRLRNVPIYPFRKATITAVYENTLCYVSTKEMPIINKSIHITLQYPVVISNIRLDTIGVLKKLNKEKPKKWFKF
jgi:hypothetical protein